MPAHVKIVATSFCALVLIILSAVVAKVYSGHGWKMILVLLPSLFIWATTVDAYVGIVFHGNPFYMSANTWPDKQMLVIVQNGVLYTVYKVIGIVVTLPLLRYLR